MEILVDSNIILDIVTEDPKWFSWSSETVAQYGESSFLAINPIIYSEISIGFDRIEDVEDALPASFGLLPSSGKSARRQRIAEYK